MSKINILDTFTINKIAAGEVIENPSSVVKELVENAIDAGAKSIFIEIQEAGRKSIRVTDNGEGFYQLDMRKAFLRHSTSKIRKLEDLEQVISLGFRGEALASIAAVAKVQLMSMHKDAKVGHKIQVEAGKVVKEEEIGCPKGTTIVVEDLFFNVPVRQKFLKSDGAEASKISEILHRLALSHPEISFKYVKDDKIIFKTPGTNNLKAVVYTLFGRECASSLIEIKSESYSFKCSGFVSDSTFTRGNRSYYFTFVNGRYVYSQILNSAIENAYRSHIMINNFPAIFLNLQIAPTEIDVNIHPKKLEVKFINENAIFKELFDLIIREVKASMSIPDVVEIREPMVKEPESPIESLDNLKVIGQKNDFENSINSLKEKPASLDLFEVKPTEKKNADLLNMDGLFSRKPEEKLFPQPTEEEPFKKPSQERKSPENFMTLNIFDNLPVLKTEFDEDVSLLEQEAGSKKTKIPELNIIGSLFKTYILAEDVKDQSMIVIDQHAAHERINYEKYRAQFLGEKIVVQHLLKPFVLNLSNYELEQVLENIALFERLGFEIEEFGTNSIIIRTVPMLFGSPNLEIFIKDILANLEKEIATNYELKLDKIMKIACTNSVKAGQKLNDLEINRLIKDLSECEEPFTCPHGRPTLINLSKKEIEKLFGRIQK